VPDPRAEPKSLPTLVSELWELVVTYAKQETVEPLKGLGRYVAFGLAGSLVLGIGLVLLVLAGLRALQTETGTVFEGNWSWAPYLITLVGCAIVIVLALSATKRKKSRS
jgi:hypothetical protein